MRIRLETFLGIALLLLVAPSYAQLGSQYFYYSPNASDSGVAIHDQLIERLLPEAGILSDNVFYPAKRLLEDLRLLVTFDEEKRMYLHLEFAERRLLEAKALAERNQTAEAVAALNDYKKSIEIFSERAAVKKIPFPVRSEINYVQQSAANLETRLIRPETAPEVENDGISPPANDVKESRESPSITPPKGGGGIIIIDEPDEEVIEPPKGGSSGGGAPPTEPDPIEEPITPPEDSPAPEITPEPVDEAIAVTLFNTAQCKTVAGNASLFKDGDWMLLVTGNFGNEIKPEFVTECLKILGPAGKDFNYAVYTGNIGKLQRLASILDSSEIDAIGTVYEPSDYANFSWDFNFTIANAKNISKIAHDAGFKSSILVTGRPLRERSLDKYGWDFGQLAHDLDTMIIQTQGAIPRGTLVADMRSLITYRNRAATEDKPVFLQITVSPPNTNANGVGLDDAKNAYTNMLAQGFRPSMWWTSTDEGKSLFINLVKFIRS
ncbi:MAG: hypothetical protein HY364_03595 [Candidatus Aenigmarchaeota archaeon]|nr:hypothetical protein [Candidatus Aenigmarchaeota archaeon]